MFAALVQNLLFTVEWFILSQVSLGGRAILGFPYVGCLYF